MKDFFRESLHIARDGILHVNEVIAIAIIIVAAVIVLLLLKDAIKKSFGRKKTTIFSHKKNRYKTRIGRRKKY